jgi:2,3-bisphosphoglycerate-independent phosphoglycerate mutase
MNFSKGYDYFFLHYKPADSAGEDGNFSQKVAMLEEFDKKLERVVQLEPDVIVICGDHSTPSYFSSHSWHPVPFLINSKLSQGKVGSQFTENSCREGTIGRILAEELMLLVLSHAGKLNKFGP